MDNITFEQLPAVVGELFVKIENIERLLQQPGKTDDLDELFTIQQASTFLRLTVPTIYGLVSRSSIPVSKKGKRLYFSKVELTAWVKEGRKKTISELQLEAKNHTRSNRRS